MATPAALGTLPSRAAASPANASAADMVGEGPQPSSGGPQQGKSRAFVQQVKTLHTQLDDIAREYPAFGSFARKAQDALKEGMVRTLSEMQSQPEESGSTPSFG